MFDLANKTALVAGGAGYLGVPVCKALVGQGAALMVADINEDRVASVVAEIKKEMPKARVEGCILDIARETACRDAVGRTVACFGGLQISVNLTCHSIGKRVEDLTESEFDAAMHINLFGAFALARESARVMQGGGSIVLFASMYGQVAPNPALYQPPMKPNPIEYGVAKAGIIQMAKYLAVHWAPRGIRVNAVAPGPFPNPKVQSTDPAFVARLAKNVPLGRIGCQSECAGAVVFLAADESSYITGHTLAVNGGWTAW